MAFLDAGRRDRFVTIEQLAESVSAGAYPVETWSTLRQEWAARRDLSGRERFAGQQATASVETEWRLGYSPEMDPERVDVPKARRLVYQGRTYEIVSASPIENRAGIRLQTIAASKVA